MIRFYFDSGSTIVRLDSSNTIVVVTVSSVLNCSSESCSGSSRTNNKDAAEVRCQTILNADERYISFSLPFRILYKCCTKNNLTKDSLSFPNLYKCYIKNTLTKDFLSFPNQYKYCQKKTSNKKIPFLIIKQNNG